MPRCRKQGGKEYLWAAVRRATHWPASVPRPCGVVPLPVPASPRCGQQLHRPRHCPWVLLCPFLPPCLAHAPCFVSESFL